MDSSTSGHVARTERSCCSYRAHIRRVTKKGEAPHYVIDGNSNFERNDDCKLHECLGNTTVRRRILSKLKVVNNLPDDAKGAHVANALRVDAGIGVSQIYTKRALREATGHAKAFREAFTKIDCLINSLSTIPHPADEVSIIEVMRPNEEDARYHVNLEKCTCGCTYWQSIGIACKHAVAVWVMYQSQLKATGEEIS